MEKNAFATLFQFMNHMALFAIAASLMLPVAVSGGQTSEYFPGNSNKGLFVVKNAVQQFNNLKHHGEALAWTLPEHLGAPDPSENDHYQGIVRYPGDGVPVFYVTQKDTDDGGKIGGYLHVVIFLSRPTTGERLRSNLLEKGKDTEDTYPPFSIPVFDSWIQSIRFDGSLVAPSVTLWDGTILTEPDGTTPIPYKVPAYEHPGGMAIVDDILFVPVDTPCEDCDTGEILLFDLRENFGTRFAPKLIKAIQLPHKLDNLAVTDYGDSFLVWVNGDGANVKKFYKTSSSNLRDPTLYLEELEFLSGSLPSETCAHQSSTFLRQTDGSLYMIGMRHMWPCWSPDVGIDYADLYRVEEPTPGSFIFEEISTYLELYCVYAQTGRICNFGAANNAYVSPSGELILYSIPHDDEDGKNPDYVRMAEFRHRDVNRTGTCTGGTGWAELYDDKNFLDRSIVFDWADRDKDDFDNFNILDGFNDKTSSVRWCAPVGCNILLYENSYYGGVPATLPGTGRVIAASDFGSFNDKVSSIRFDPNSICENSPPIADAGPDQTFSAGPDCTSTVNLDGSESSDPDADSLSYTWTWDGGSVAGVNPTITLPLGIHTVTLTVDDGKGGTDSDAVEITVEDNTPPAPDVDTLPEMRGECSLSIASAPTATDNCAGTVTGTSTDPLNYTDQGTYTVIWVYDDGDGNVTTQKQNVVVQDTTPPVPDVASLADVRGECSAETTLTPTATDNCKGAILGTTTDPLSYAEQGTHTVTWSYDDGNGNTTHQIQNVIVNDTTPPEISVSVSPDTLWPPNHKMVLCTPTVVASDNCNPGPSVSSPSITMNEGNESDYQIHSSGDVYLRCERSGNTRSRIYTITYTATDEAGNTANASATVTVPHDMGKKKGKK